MNEGHVRASIPLLILLAGPSIVAACQWFANPIEAPDSDTIDGEDPVDAGSDDTDGEEGEVLECSSSADCDDANACNGVEVCLIEGVCMPGDPLPEGAECDAPAGAEGRCVGGACVPLTCGDGSVDPGEECDDANATPGDGCEIDCTYSCHDAAGCSDGDVCNGVEACGADTHRCEPGAAAGDGEPCGESPRRICLGGRCEDSVCGDGFVDAGSGESCEPPGADACSIDCRWACTAVDDCPDDGEMCNGEEFCDTAAHQCDRRDAPPAGTVCGSDPYRECRDLRCRDAVPCGNGRLDPGEQCDDGTGNSDTTPDACRTDCTLAGCGDGVIDSGEACDAASGFCSSSCQFTAPAATWRECSDSSGRTVFLFIQAGTTPRTWSQMRDQCRSLIEGYAPRDFRFYGLAVLTDGSVWSCIEPALATSQNYFVGIYQDMTASDYAEPAGGFYWTAYDGSSWVNLSRHQPSTYFLVTYFNDAGGSYPDADIGYVRWLDARAWELYDWSGVATETWPGICMIQF